MKWYDWLALLPVSVCCVVTVWLAFYLITVFLLGVYYG